ncbi:hypothetical protein PENARI_c005G07603 [Penicillium arizonense]|uniref:Transcription factor domain-containing protein n=1 Tax=Penicillium arizonense TaxID=1835702 RepID=A0A1F5LP41_PENAI|nr:hypothetical protein PENARI_c005G07603 [Penicillium arizonense]OGE54983.1 hypothetical protein PENARI_c005G07603 [Penicillium arizonense]
MSILLGRPRLVNAIDCDVELPINCNFPESIESMHLSTAQAYSSHDTRVPSSVCLSLLTYELSQKIHEIRTLRADKPGLQDYTIIQRLHSEILSLVKELPSTIRTPNPDTSWDLQFPIIPRLREKIFTAAYSLLMALHRPHVAKHMQSRETVLKAGLAILESQQRFFEAITQFHYAYFGNAFFSIDAVIVLSTVVSSFPSKDVDLLQQIVLATQQAIGRLCLIETENEMARAGIKIARSSHQTVKDAYNRSKLLNPVPTSTSITHEYQGLEDDTFQRSHQITLPELGDSFDTGFPIYHNAVTNEADLNESMMSMNQTGATEFDISYWMGYRQQIVNDAVDMFDSNMN